MASELIQLASAIAQALLPIAARMLERGLAGGDPLAVLVEEDVHEIIPAPLKLEVAEAVARARLAGSGAP